MLTKPGGVKKQIDNFIPNKDLSNVSKMLAKIYKMLNCFQPHLNDLYADDTGLYTSFCGLAAYSEIMLSGNSYTSKSYFENVLHNRLGYILNWIRGFGKGTFDAPVYNMKLFYINEQAKMTQIKCNDLEKLKEFFPKPADGLIMLPFI